MKLNAPNTACRALSFLLLTIASFGYAAASNAQEKSATKPTAAATPVVAQTASKVAPINASMTPVELAKAALTAQGGEKFRNLKNMMLIGSVDLYSPSSTQSLTGKFGMILEGIKVRQDVQSPIASFQLIYDGVNNYSSLRGMTLPPPSKYGLTVLTKYDQAGFTVTALPDKKKERAFRITDAEGNVTDYYVEIATGRVIRYEIPYNGFIVSVEHKTLKEFEGVLIPVNFVQKLAAPQGDFYAEFKVKEVKLNQELPADTFKIPGQ